MGIEEHYSRIFELQSEMLNDALCNEKECCPICRQCNPCNSENWQLPHESAKTIQYVCSDECAEEWCERNWEELEELQG